MNGSDNSRFDYMKNRPVLHIFILITVFGSGFLFGNINNTAPLAASKNVTAQQENTENSRKELELLRTENESLKRQLVNTPVATTLNKTASNTGGTNGSQGDISRCEEELKALTKTASEAESTLIGKNLEHALNNADGFKSIEDKLENNFKNESTDVNWANQEQQKYMNFFSQSEELAGIGLIDVVCKSEQCKISIAANSVDESNNISGKVASVLQKSKKPSNFMVVPDLEKSNTNLYVRRDGKSFEFN